MSELTQVSKSKSFGGWQEVYSHKSESTKCVMKFSIYQPPCVQNDEKVPVLYWLSGLTCTEENFIIKSGFQRYAAQYKICVVGPDTSPRGVNIEGEDDDWDFGSGAGFYVDACTDKWKDHYRMYSYVTKELIDLVERNFNFVMPGKRAISGHSMGGHGALICSMKNPGLYSAVTAFAPISNPISSKWGQKAFTGYLGDDKEKWEEWDATCLVKNYNGPPLHLLIDQGTSDQWLKEYLIPKNFVNACVDANVPIIYREQEQYDHGYFFVGTFFEDHCKHLTKILYA